MRKIVILSCIFLSISGIILHFRNALEEISGFSILSTLHIWLGIFFIVIFPMYSWDHIKTHKRRLYKVTRVSVSGIIQSLGGMILILSGIILLLYGSGKLALSTEIHYWTTYILAGSLLVHYIIKK